jgi:U3 small nucleolar RNA-associated protein 12
MARHSDGERFAVGYADGSIRLWSAATKSVLITFDGHRKGITALAFDASGTRLASGSQDTDIIIWDVLAESGLFRCAVEASSMWK